MTQDENETTRVIALNLLELVDGIPSSTDLEIAVNIAATAVRSSKMLSVVDKSMVLKRIEASVAHTIQTPVFTATISCGICGIEYEIRENGYSEQHYLRGDGTCVTYINPLTEIRRG